MASTIEPTVAGKQVDEAEITFQLDEFYLDLQEDGNKIRLLDRDEIRRRPFPGLRPYKTSEFQLFKGRGGQAEELIQRLKKNKFLAVIGSSGTGKSSLIRAGLIPQLFGGYLHEAGNNWNIAICRPGKNPLGNLAIALASVKERSREQSRILHAYNEIYPLLSSSIYGLLDVNNLLNHENPDENKRNLLVIIDQFEELFRFSRSDLAQDNIESHFVNLLLKAALHPAGAVYIITTMRSEFLGDCVSFQSLPEAINSGQYLVPKLDRSQIKEVIEGPIKLTGKSIAPGLVELLINKIDESTLKENHDQLPILQHALMRTYQQAEKNSSEAEICYEDYKSTGGMEEALANHARDKFNQLTDRTSGDELSKKQEIAKIIFQALTDLSTGQKGGRRPLQLSNIYELATLVHATPDEVNEVINNFRGEDTSFIMPPDTTPLSPNVIIDISHESLMRNWDELDEWIREELKYGKLYTRLNEKRLLYENYKDEPVKGILLRELESMESQHPMNWAWASRYHTDLGTDASDEQHKEIFSKNMKFLEESITLNNQAEEQEKNRIEQEIQRAEKEKNRKKVISILTVATIISVIALAWAIVQTNKATTEAARANKSASQEKDARQKAVTSQQDALNQARIANTQKNQIAALQKISDLKARQADSLRLIAEGQKAELGKQSKNLEMQLAINALQREYFFRSRHLDSVEKQRLISAIFKQQLPKVKKSNFSKFYDAGMLSGVNMAVRAGDTVTTNPVVGLRLADTVWMQQSSKPVQGLLENIFKENIFYKQKIKSPADIDAIDISPNSGRFIASGQASFLSGSLNKDSLKIEPAMGAQSEANEWIALSFVNDNKAVGLSINGDVVELGSGGGQIVRRIRVPVSAKFSPDGSQLAAIYRDGLKLYTLSGKTSNISDSATLASSIVYTQAKKLLFSSDSKRLIAINTGYSKIWDTATKRELAANNVNLYALSSACFTTDGKYLVTAKSTRINLLRADSLNSVSGFYVPLPKEYGGFTSISNIALSQDGKKLILQSGGKAYLITTAKNDLLFKIDPLKRANSITSQPVVIRLLNGTAAYSPLITPSFLTSEKIISADESGYMYLWDINARYANLNDAFASVRPITRLSFEEKLARDLIDFNALKASTDKVLLETAANYYYGKGVAKTEYDRKARELYLRLLQLDKENPNEVYIKRIIQINTELIANEKNEIDVRSYYRSRVQRTAENIELTKEYLKLAPDDDEIKGTLSRSYGSLSFYLLFTHDYDGAIKSANTGLSLNPENTWINTNLALGYLLTDRFEDAKKIYTDFKDQENEGRKFRQMFLDDFKDLQAAEIITGNEPGVLKIKEILK
ncbi:hypothetical protein GS399_19540 [Pedobacter sp. HMF7647]|uniref:Novel STAND NTPase 1 domain-containing protein n=1 Tax=Hufsiella arboris TaxID=2695275 RepID=A0A7K1YEZ1_9SPHI|nr:hypothetical protein [Hufsiella arboris]MXV53165.1 hypothetical protein [Hufsiella arboris]